MLDVIKQIDYWKAGAINDIESAEILLEKKKYLHGLFFCHLTIEKALKANYVKANNKLAPKTHQLRYLHNNSNIKLNIEQEELLGILMNYQIEGRYPEYKIQLPNSELVKEYLKRTKELLKWLVEKL
ncbi:MAG: HEPN domain-containing protein [Ignavibacteriales bacterium]|nr:HEPN domain-containing protein [Ignavibacteriales bacterium]